MPESYSLGASFEKIVHRISKVIKQPRLNSKASEATFDRCRQLNLSLSKISKPIQYKRFRKHKNLIEANRANCNYTGTPLQKSREFKFGTSNAIFPRKKTLQFQPKTKEELFSDFVQARQTPYSLNSQKLQSLLLKQQLKSQRNLLGYNILRLEQKYNFTRFELHSLYSMYHTLIGDAKGDIRRFKNGFQVILNMMKISIRPEILENILNDQRKLDFQSFIEMYSKIDQAIFRQTIIDYVDILFQGISDRERISFEDIVTVMKNRITQNQSEEIAKIIFEQLDRPIQKAVAIAQIYVLANNCESFGKTIFRVYSGEMQD